MKKKSYTFILFINVMSNVNLLITGFLARLAQWVPLVEEELLPLPKHMS